MVKVVVKGVDAGESFIASNGVELKRCERWEEVRRGGDVLGGRVAETWLECTGDSLREVAEALQEFARLAHV